MVTSVSGTGIIIMFPIQTKQESRTRDKEFNVQSALVISNSKGLSEMHRDTRTSTYQISRMEKKIKQPNVPNSHVI